MSSDKTLARPHDGRRPTELQKLNERSRTIFRQIVESYLATGEPVGSRNLSRHLPMTLSPASVRNVMSDLEHLGLIYAPHTSAGRLPTESGLRLFVDGLLEVGDLTDDERRQIEAQIRCKREKSIEQVLTEAGEMISGLSHCAGVVLADKQVRRLKHIEFVPLEPGKALVVLVGEDQAVENRVISLPRGLTPSALTEAANYLNARIRGLTIGEARARIEKELATAKAELDALTQKVIEAGLATWSGADGEQEPDRARPGQPAQGRVRAGEPGAHPPAVRRSRDQARPGPAAGPRRDAATACTFSSARRTSCSRCPALR